MNQPLSFFENLARTTNVRNLTTIRIEQVFTDSRQQVKNGLFVPLVGERFDGHDFLLQAIDHGAVASFWQQERPLPAGVPADFPVLIVADPLTALQKAAKQYLELVKPLVVAITGSNGKTTTKDVLATLVKQRWRTHKTQGNYNNHIGMPLSILAMEAECEILILEMGMNDFGEISFLSKLAEPDYAVITNIGESHLEQLGTRAGIAKAKLEIRHGLKHDGTVVIDGDEPLLSHSEGQNVVACGYDLECDVQIAAISGNEEGQFFTLRGETTSFYLPLLGKHNIKNACFALVLARRLGMNDGAIQKGLRCVQLTGMRLERLKGKAGSLLINDAYNASPTSMKAALEALAMLTAYPRKVAVLGDIYELGANEEALHRDVAQSVTEEVTHVITVGEKGKWIGKALRARDWGGAVVICETKEKAILQIEPLLSPETVILFKASRGMQLETLVDQLTCR